MRVPFLLFLSIFAIEYLGLGYRFPALNAMRISLLASAVVVLYIIGKNRVGDLFAQKQAKLLLFLLLMTSASIIYAIVQTHSLNALKAQIGYFMIFVSGYFLLRDAKRTDAFLILLTAFHLILVYLNLPKFFSEVRAGAFQAGYFLGDGNDFAWALNIVLPFTLYGAHRVRSKLLKLLCLCAFGVLIFGIIGSASRGATLAACAGMVYLLMSSRKKSLVFAFVLLASGLVFTLAPSTYFERMETLGSYEEDSSAKSRLIAWKAATNMALENPLGVGAGNFNSAYGRIYRPEDALSNRWISAHSIYFVVLGEYGFIGLIVLIMLIISNIKDNVRTRKLIIANNGGAGNIPDYWPVYLNMSIIAYAVGGIFLGGINYPHLYVLTFLTLSAKFMVESRMKPSLNGAKWKKS